MPNGYDSLYDKYGGSFDWLEYCQSLLDIQSKMVYARKDWNKAPPELRAGIISQLSGIEAIVSYLKDLYHSKIKPGIAEHNDWSVVRDELDRQVRAGQLTQADADAAWNKISKNQIDGQRLEKLLMSVKESLLATIKHITDGPSSTTRSA